ncbi:hypothetical protein MAR_008244 [Mya arenaria]|uniref:Uncharacterized protein n=1 Tax=Mya arenaria TaxID=6604 RepID=A0ABY7DYD4_MYAAR|nr:hypothetical protein MAR_008244 [Mya arenaria]
MWQNRFNLTSDRYMDPNDPTSFPSQQNGSFSSSDPLRPVGPAVMDPGRDTWISQRSPINTGMSENMSHMPKGHCSLKRLKKYIHRVGSPEPLVPDLSVSDLVQPPVPEINCYLNQFDRQEHAITKQVNTAYRDTSAIESQQPSYYTPNNRLVNFPLDAQNHTKGQSQTDVMHGCPFQNIQMQSQQHEAPQSGGGDGGQYNPATSSSSSMQVQQMHLEQDMAMQQKVRVGITAMPQSMTLAQGGLTQDSMTSSFGMPIGGDKRNPGSMPINVGNTFIHMGPPPSNMNKHMSLLAPSQNPQQVLTPGRNSQRLHTNSMGNTNVWIRQKSPNTIQNVHDKQSNTLPDKKYMIKPDLDFVVQYINPGGLIGNMDGNVPTSRAQYFPGRADPGHGPGENIYGHVAGPWGPAGISSDMDCSLMPNPRMDQGIGPPNACYQRMDIDQRMDVHHSMSVAPIMRNIGPSADQIIGERPDAMVRQEIVMSNPRMGPRTMGYMSDPKTGLYSDSVSEIGPESCPIWSVSPESRDNPFTLPIGPAVQRSTMVQSLPSWNSSSPDTMSNMNVSLSMGGPMSAFSSVYSMASIANTSSSEMDEAFDPMTGGTSLGEIGSPMLFNSPPYSCGSMGSPMVLGGSTGMSGPRMQGPPGFVGPCRPPGAPLFSCAQYQQIQQHLYAQTQTDVAHGSDDRSPRWSKCQSFGHLGP